MGVLVLLLLLLTSSWSFQRDVNPLNSYHSPTAVTLLPRSETVFPNISCPSERAVAVIALADCWSSGLVVSTDLAFNSELLEHGGFHRRTQIGHGGGHPGSQDSRFYQPGLEVFQYFNS